MKVFGKHYLHQKTKYKAKAADGFGSKLEKSVFDMLRLREAAGEIKNIKRQQRVVLQDGPRPVQITWRIDFSFERTSDDSLVYVEAKGFPTRDYILKLKLFRKNPPADLEIYKGHYLKPTIAEIIKKGSTCETKTG